MQEGAGVRLWLCCCLLSAWYIPHLCSAAPNPGAFCQQVVAFDLADNANITLVEKNAKTLYETFPRWVTNTCLVALWQMSCMSAYGSYASDGQGYCHTDCLNTLYQCNETIQASGSYSTDVVAYVNALCSSSSYSSGCHNAGSAAYADLPEGWSTVCPLPLRIPSTTSGGHTHGATGTACVLPCPTILFTDSENQQIRDIIKWCSFCGLFLAAAVVVFYSEAKHMLLRLLCVGIITFNFWTLVLLFVDDYNPQTCADDAHFYLRKPLCVIQAAMVSASTVWCCVMLMCIAVQLWMGVILRTPTPKLGMYQQRTVRVAGCLCILTVIITLSAQNLGFDWEGHSGPVCLYLISETDVFFWALFFCPIMIIAATVFVLMVHSMVYVNMRMMASANIRSRWKQLHRLFQTNRRMALFTIMFGYLSLIVCAHILYIWFHNPKGYVYYVVSYAKCLLEHTYPYDDPNSGIAICGNHPEPRPSKWQVIVVILYPSSLGILCFIVYGTQGKGAIILERFTESVRQRWTTVVPQVVNTARPRSVSHSIMKMRSQSLIGAGTDAHSESDMHKVETDTADTSPKDEPSNRMNVEELD